MTAAWIDDKTIVFVTGAASGMVKRKQRRFLQKALKYLVLTANRFLIRF